MMAAIARIAVERNSPRLHWSVLDWNETAIGFYERLGAAREQGRRHYYLLGEDLRRLAEAAQGPSPQAWG
jgi:ribosomal protein S18 acetylase RimI-like enzyme